MMMELKGRIINNQYKITDKIGEGGMSHVWLARDMKHNKCVAVKILKNDKISQRVEDIIRFQKEARIVSKLKHKNIVSTLEIGEYDGFNFIIMEHIDGKNLHDHIINEIPFNKTQVMEIIIGICHALEYVHESGIIHRDLKPGNIMITSKTQGETRKALDTKYHIIPKLLDFGLSELKELTRIEEREIAGTFYYMSPEQSGIIRRPVDERSDLYSLGIIFYQLLTGELPFKGKDIGTILHQQIAKIPKPPGQIKKDISGQLEDIVLKLMSKEQEERYQSAGGLLADLIQYKEGNRDFPLGKKDRLKKLPFRTRLIGRDEEVSHLKDLYNDSRKGKGKICLISGVAGKGKTRLAEELQGFVYENGGIFLSAKFYAQENKFPFQPFKEVLTDYINILQAKQKEDKERIISRIKDTIGELGEIIIRLNPSMKKILGDVPPLVQLNATDREKKRFLMVCSRFFCNLGQSGKPIVLFFDDLQWADESSMSLLCEIVSDMEEAPLLILGTFRENEIDQDHSLYKLIQSAKIKGYPLEEIHISLFNLAQMNKFVADLLLDNEKNIKEISKYIFEKSKGNPFFAIELLRQLITEKVIFYRNEKWNIDREKIQQINLSFTILDIVMKRIKLLKEEETTLLSYAAVIGREFELMLLFKLSELREEQVVTIVDRAIDLQLLEASPIEKGRIVFVHERIKDAFYKMIGEEKKQELHLKIAYVLEDMNRENPVRVIFALAHHYTAGGDKNKSLKYSIPAARNAKQGYANEEAIRYFIIARNLLEEKAGKGTKEWIEICEDLGEVYLTVGKYDNAITVFNELLPFKVHNIDKAKIYRQLSTAYFKKGDWQNCEKQGRMGLRLLGEKLPFTKAGVFWGIIKEVFIHILHILFPWIFVYREKKQVNPEYILSIWLYVILNWMYMLNDTMKTLRSVLRMLNIAESKIGRSRELGMSIGAYASVCMSIPLFRRAIKYHKKALTLRKELGDEWGIAQSLQWMGYCYQWKGMYKESLKYFQESLDSFMKIGDMWETGMVLTGFYFAHYYSADYHKAINYLSQYSDLSQSVNNNFGIVGSKIYSVELYTEMGEFNKAREECTDGLLVYEDKNDQYLVCVKNINLSFFSMERGNLDDALNYLEKAKIINESNYFMQNYVVQLYHLLAEALLLHYEKEKIILKYKKRLCLKKIKNACKKAMEKTKNWSNQYGAALRIQGKYYALTGKWKKAEQFFLKSIEHHKALGRRCELAKSYYEYGKWLMETGKEENGKFILQEAYSIYKEIGVIVCEMRTADLLDLTREDETPQERLLDKNRLSSLISVSQHISSILNIDELLKTIIDKAIKVTGAQRGYLLIVNEQTGELEVRSARNIDHNEISSREFQISKGIIHNVFESGKRIITTNAQENEDYSKFQSVVSYHLKSILCVPIKYGDKIKGVCYLDNPLSTGVFSEEDGDILNIFISQVVICIENARAYKEIDLLNKTLEKKVEERTKELHAAKREAEKANQAKTNFLAKMSHEIRTPLSGVIGSAEIIIDSQQIHQHNKYARLIIHESEKLLKIINTLLDIAKIEAGKLELVNKSFSIYDLLKSIKATMGIKARDKGLEFFIKPENDIPEFLIGDATRLYEVLINLTGNAIKFTEKGNVRITIEKTGLVDDQVKLLFKVIDTGIGIAEEKQKTIFDSYMQADSSITEKFGGTGLGTTIAKQLVLLMGGEIGLESQSGRGSTFWFTALFKKGHKAREGERKTEIHVDVSILMNKSILVVEDYKINQEIVKKHLENTGSYLVIAENGMKALKEFREKDFDLILMDIQLPEMDGYTITRQIRRTEKGSRIPIIGMTANIFESDRQKCFASGMDDIISKPFQKRDFIEKILGWINKQGGESAITSELKEDKPNMEETRTPINFEQALKEFDLDKEFLLNLTEKFLTLVKTQAKEIRDAAENNDRQKIKELAHSIKGGAANLTANPLAAIAFTLEQIENSSGIEYILSLVQKLEKEIKRLEKWYNSECKKD